MRGGHFLYLNFLQKRNGSSTSMKPDRGLDPERPPSWIADVRRKIQRWIARGAGTAWVVAVSGGSDSVGLLRVLAELAPELGLSLSVAHLNHGTRGQAAEADAALVEALAHGLGLPVDLGTWQPSRKSHFEADARRARYAWLIERAKSRGASAVAVGHTLDDQAETILHRIVRGSGLRGIAGMPKERWLCTGPPILLVRPLLSVSREAIREHLAELGQEYRDDASNLDLSRTRARIRNDLLPRLADEYNPRVALALVRLGNLARQSECALDDWLRSLSRETICHASDDRIELDRDRLRALPLFVRTELLRRAWRAVGWPERGMSQRRWRRLASLTRRGEFGGLAIGGGIELSTTGTSIAPPERFVLKRVLADSKNAGWPASSELTALDVPGSAAWMSGTLHAFLDDNVPRDETIDLDRVVPPLLVRAPRPGDRFEPLGMGGKSTPLCDFFRGRKVARKERALVPLLCDAEGIIWVVGHRIADRVKLSEQTKRRLGLRWEANKQS
jgi:tRNA(Ile)-lysidine synthase